MKLGLATEEISEDVLNVLLDHASSADPQSAVRRSIGVSDVVVTRQMKRWHAVHTLETVYRDAYNNQLNDRYKPKVAEYHELSRQARDRTLKFGIGLVNSPIPKANAPVLSTTPGTSAGATYYVAVSWVSASGQEGAVSDSTAIATPDATFLVVTPVNPPAIAAGFNVYVGATENSMMLQTPSPQAVGTSFELTGAIAAGRIPGTGQSPDTYVIGGSTVRRG